MDALLLAVGASAVFHLDPLHLSVLLAVIPLWWATGQIMGLYQLSTAARIPASLPALAWTSLVMAAGLVGIFLIDPHSLTRIQLLLFGLGSPLLVGAGRLLYLRFFGAEHWERRILVLGGGRAGIALLSAIRAHPGHGIRVVALLSDVPEEQGALLLGVPVLPHQTVLLSLISQQDIEEVVLATPELESAALREELALCYQQGIPVRAMPQLYEEITGQVPVEHIGTRWLGALPLGQPRGSISAALNRLVDVVGSLAALLLLSPLMLLVALAVRFSSPGPILFRQWRVGLHGQPFQIMKFRTMMVEAEAGNTPVWASANDPRATTVGRWLRRMHLDELPQLVNVLLGHMSLVGPRPERPEFVCQLEQHFPLYPARHSLRPGITGWAQVSYRYGASLEDSLAKLRYDLYYIRHQSLLLDGLILGRTALRVLGLRGR